MILELNNLATKVDAAARGRGMIDASRFAGILFKQAEIGGQLRAQADTLLPDVFESRRVALMSPAMFAWRDLTEAAQVMIADLARQTGAVEALSAIVGPLPAPSGEAAKDVPPQAAAVAPARDLGPNLTRAGVLLGRVPDYEPLARHEIAAADDGRTVPRRSELR